MFAPRRLRLSRFGNRFSRADPIRLALDIAGYPFDDVQFSDFDWPLLRSSRFPSQLPLLEFDDRSFMNPRSMLRYAGRLGGLYPSDPFEALHVDDFVSLGDDLWDQFMPASLMPAVLRAPEEKDEQMEEPKPVQGETVVPVTDQAEGTTDVATKPSEELQATSQAGALVLTDDRLKNIQSRLQLYEDHLKKAGEADKTFLAGPRMGVADLQVFCAVRMLESELLAAKGEAEAKQFMDQFPLVKGLLSRVKDNAKVNEFVERTESGMRTGVTARFETEEKKAGLQSKSSTFVSYSQSLPGKVAQKDQAPVQTTKGA